MTADPAWEGGRGGGLGGGGSGAGGLGGGGLGGGGSGADGAGGGVPESLGHLSALRDALVSFESHLGHLDAWGAVLAHRLLAGGRLLTAGNGGSAAHAEHLACEFVGRYQRERRPFSALALHVDGSALTALVNDYGEQQMFARQVQAHGRPGDVLMLLSTSGRSPNVVAAAAAGRAAGVTVWSLTGPAPNPLAEASDENVPVDAVHTATIQEIHQVAVHLLCAAFDRHHCHHSPGQGG